MSQTLELIAKNKQTLTQLIALTKKEDKAVLAEIEPLVAEASQNVQRLIDMPAGEIQKFKNDYISMMALFDQLTLLLQNSQDKTRATIAQQMKQMKAQKGYTK